MSYWVYILQSEKDQKYYIGSTSNVEKRLDYHNRGLQRSTKNRIPFKRKHKKLTSKKSIGTTTR